MSITTIYVVYNFIHSADGGNEHINIYSDYLKAKEEYNSFRKKYIDTTPNHSKCYITEDNDSVRYEDHEYSVKIGIKYALKYIFLVYIKLKILLKSFTFVNDFRS